ncbi:hypothetical protein OsJ_36261 [Oryza sativa Japonica Group]|uniref:NB-ARC domain-containing protein n=2 Tax=Oryza TaxID=4527 RepID=B9GDE1_ORYSJ|nr:hypothetical protein OsJ_36261 [Oryza sativa Japonica Group]
MACTKARRWNARLSPARRPVRRRAGIAGDVRPGAAKSLRGMAEAAAVFAGKAVVQPAITYLVKKIVDRIPDGDLCKRLQQKLPFVEAILYAVDRQQTLSNPSLSEVVWQLRDAIQEAEDALDTLEFLDLKSSANNRSKVSLSSLLSSISRKFHVADSSRATENLKDALKNLDAVLDNAGRSLPAIYPSSCSHGKAHIQDSASIQEVTKELRTTIFGRLKEKDAIIDWLGVLTPNIRDQKLSLCAIVGAGGMGKTTLAQFVCQDKKVQDHFANKIIWADVSKIFDPKVLVRKISGSFNRYKASADGLDTIMTDKFLLVLDDARDDAQSERWQQFLDLIRKNAPMGGKILLTTQIRPVANAVEGQMPPDTYKCLELGGLDQENTLKLFNHHAFGDLSPSDCFELQLIGEQIARKLKGCPLLARTIGRHLQGNTDHARWNTILNHDIHKVDDVATEIKKVLRLSYESLSNEVQVCFRYCSIFPPHYKFKMEEMVEMWKLHLPKTTVSRIAQIGSLTTLRELNGFSVKRTDGHKITELKDLRKLQKVIVLDVQNVIDHTEASDAELDKKSDLKVLSLEWCADQASCDGRILNKLVPDSNLKHLVISGYNGTRPPLWMESKYFSNLVYLKLDGCVEWDKLPPFGYLWTLKHLFLKNLPKLEYIASSSYSTVVYGYRDTSPDVLPPHLITFVVKNCLGLSELPSLPFSLRYLDIDRVGMSSLPTMCTHMGRRRVSLVESQLSILNVESCNLLVSLNGFLQEEHCRVLTVLSLVCCHMLISLPDASDFKRMSKLESIRIIECNRLSSLGGLEALSHLKILRIEHCANLVTTSSRLPPASDESTYLKLETLEIDDHQLLAISPIRNLCLTKKLIILEREKMAELPLEWLLQNRSHLEHIEISNAELLKSLPNMHEWHTLRSMLLHNTPLLQSLPLMPPNLWVLDINGCCNELHGECQSGGSEWSKICRIHSCNITPKI